MRKEKETKISHTSDVFQCHWCYYLSSQVSNASTASEQNGELLKSVSAELCLADVLRVVLAGLYLNNMLFS